MVTPESEFPIRPSTATRSTRVVADQLAKSLGDDGGTAIVLDLAPTIGVHIAARLNGLGLANAVVIVPRWPYANAILAVDGLVNALIATAGTLAERVAPNVVFVFDVERNKPLPGRRADDPLVDNRYVLSTTDLPNLATLRAGGIDRILKITRA